MENYYKKCGSCKHMDLCDKSNGKFHCDKGRWFLATEPAGSCYEYDSRKSGRMIEFAREHSQGAKYF